MAGAKTASFLVVVPLLALRAATVTDEGDRTLAQRCEAEIVELHQFLEHWSNAELPPTEEAFARFADVLSPDFLIIDPDGSQLGREPILAAIWKAHGRWRDSPGRIRIENYRMHHAGGGLALATYEEWHDLPGVDRGRLSSVLFGVDDKAPNGLVWLHLHEVWIEPDKSQG